MPAAKPEAPPRRQTSASPGQGSSIWLKAIVVFYVGRGVLLVALGLDLLQDLGENWGTTATRWIEEVHLDSEHRYARVFIERLSQLNITERQNLSLGSVLYGVLLFVEGAGLWCIKRWAAYLSVVTVVLFIPFEVYDLIRARAVPTIVLLFVNVAIGWYLTVTVIRESRHGRFDR
jgi:uncharacterized membrane protein (DUF2068 family)